MLNEFFGSHHLTYFINKERETFEVKIPKWTKTTGEFVEYQIIIQYLEGDRK